jgi:hypothetical protein
VTDLLPADALTGKRIAVSISDSADLARLGLTDTHVRLALGEIARAVLVAGGGLLYGGHLEEGGHTPFLVEEFQRWQRDESQHPHADETDGELHSGSRQRTGQLVLSLAWSVHRQTPLSRIKEYDDTLHTGGEVVCLSADGHRINPRGGRGEDSEPETDPRVVVESLTGLRRWMRDHSHGRVVVGGRRRGYQGAMPGVLEETLLSLEAEQPVYVAGGFGGVALDIARALKTAPGDWPPPADAEEPQPGLADGLAKVERLKRAPTWDGLHNGLTDEENQRLAITHRPSEIAALISRGLGRLETPAT